MDEWQIVSFPPVNGGKVSRSARRIEGSQRSLHRLLPSESFRDFLVCVFRKDASAVFVVRQFDHRVGHGVDVVGWDDDSGGHPFVGAYVRGHDGYAGGHGLQQRDGHAFFG